MISERIAPERISGMALLEGFCLFRGRNMQTLYVLGITIFKH